MKGRSKTISVLQMTWFYMQKTIKMSQKVLELINKFSKIRGYKINIQKSLAFPYINNKLSEKEIKKITAFTISSKIIKYLGINSTKEVKDLYTEDQKMLMDTNKWKDIKCSWTKRLNSAKAFIQSKVIHRSDTTPTKIPVTFFFLQKQKK